MEAYTGFAEVYDSFMDNIPYEEWCSYLTMLLKENGVQDGLVVDLGCGTGNITELLQKSGYDCIGIDNSEEMLSIAREKNNDQSILYLLQDMREFELYGTIKAAVSICDSMNYILDEEELKDVFRLVNNYLDPEGIFIFDLNTEYKYRNILGQNVIAENREESSFIWENEYYEEEGINEYNLTIYVKDKEQLYRRYEETHYQRAYSLQTIQMLIEEAGMEYVTAYDAFTKEPPKEDSERIYVIAREKRQENKFYN
ncbi:class I SAM-dependent DNA methyltransferase [Anaeromicropila populeti]|uniref:Ubiquinone/menaquinone biosynthesis C-methylase UbiE n=1 Tax=Anaeromicropila populeti TaxID=37658 RepID=A0A1I6HQ52_9FIRM|nr:class I SAM-dependent methyltransferase [Anaeromicropila populeti]SFR56400.1 Ubiquinone/menaquinone biosynthesis C-methylase UbiE [Anaeromicropila populeti]